MSSVLKRLRERSEMREAGIDDRGHYRGHYRELRELRERGHVRARHAFEVPDTAKPEAKSRSAEALAYVDAHGMSLRSLARAAKILLTGKG